MDYTLTIVIPVITFVVGWLIRTYFDSYLKKKGENLAVKEDLDAINRQLESIRSEFIAPNAYAAEKAKGLPTKEDVEEITRKVEAVKSDVSVKLEVIKWELGKKATVHRLAAEKEFGALAEIGKILYELKISTMNLRPTMDRIDPNGPEIERHNRRYGEWAKSHDAFMDAVEKNKLFLLTYLYRQFTEIRHLSRKEASGFEAALQWGEGKLGLGSYKEGEKNIEEMNKAIESALVAIRKRYDIEGQFFMYGEVLCVGEA